MSTLPTVNRRDVTAAPIQTSRHGIVVSGISLNIRANKSVITIKENTKFIDSNTTSEIGSNVPTSLSAAEREAVITSEVSNRNPVAITRPREKKRCLRATLQKLFVLCTFQIMLRAS